MIRVDLDELEAFYSRIDFDRSPQVVAVVRELRTAREVVREAKLEASPSPWLRDAIRAHDEVVGS